ncbi:TIGR03915 family putative DNA repair protein [Hymenobacter defluvii]|nr:TIGR03915 family putative DNA repair protein [Hymenobacter defluvii]
MNVKQRIMSLDYVYDGSFDGLLTVVLEMYERQAVPNSVQPAGSVQGGLFTSAIPIDTSEEKATRVWNGLLKYMNEEARRRLYHTFLSERPDRELLICRFVQQAVAARGRVDMSENLADDTVRLIAHISQQLGREKHRMEAFVRFEKTQDELFHATIEPDFDVLPLIAPHFTKRYADQRWLIFDRRRGYGLYYDLHRTDIVQFEAPTPQRRTDVSATVLDEREPLFRLLWQTYFDHANIPERRNLKLHRRHVPLRYWRYLSEKQPRETRFTPIDNKRPVQKP